MFSPNVLLRPLYQESVLPNIAVVGGGSEISYWMQLKTIFKEEKIPFPILVLRNSVLILTEQQSTKLSSFGFTLDDIFKEEHFLHNKYILSHKEDDFSIEEYINDIENRYECIISKISDMNIKKIASAQFAKGIKSLIQIEKKILRSEKQKKQIEIQQISKLKQILFPMQSLQERHDNFMAFYLYHGNNFIEILKDNLDPLNPNFVVLTL